MSGRKDPVILSTCPKSARNLVSTLVTSPILARSQGVCIRQSNTKTSSTPSTTTTTMSAEAIVYDDACAEPDGQSTRRGKNRCIGHGPDLFPTKNMFCLHVMIRWMSGARMRAMFLVDWNSGIQR
ncbi:unnamed protein product [Strongylus vulgaris]|uniref:Uncharacterized protein n=1 Tax=Strongylus vulgaris TaxID=40348 RepID=A0A3P7J4T6_STRVU|nr:unnamed protein product [Strongylus vulgaris]